MIVLALVLTVLLDTTIRRHLPGTEMQLMLLPSLSLATALYIGIHARTSGQLGYAVLLGLIVDCFSARPLGYFGFLFGTTAYLAWRVRKYVPPDAVIPRVIGQVCEYSLDSCSPPSPEATPATHRDYCGHLRWCPRRP